MRVALAAAALVIGSVTLVGQLISTLDFALAQRLGLQEKSDRAAPLFSGLELNTARWDVAVLWAVLPAAVLMLIEHSWWPWVALAAGGVYLDAGGREIAKLLGLRAHGVAVGAPQELRLALLYLTALSGLGAALIAYSLAVLA